MIDKIIATILPWYSDLIGGSTVLPHGPQSRIQTQDEVIMSFGRDAAMYMVGPHDELSKLCNQIECSALE
jgi:hypothetical protein